MIVDVPLEFYRFFAENPERAALEYLSIPAGARKKSRSSGSTSMIW